MKKILVLGSGPHSRMVRSIPWQSPKVDLNVADYEVVIVNLAESAGEVGLGAGALEWMFKWQQWARLLFSPGAEVVVVGHPRSGSPAANHFRDVLPSIPIIETSESGTEIRDVHPSFAEYMAKVKRWRAYARAEIVPLRGQSGEYLREIAHGISAVETTFQPHAYTLFRTAVAFSLEFTARRGDEKLLGHLLWYPESTKVTPAEAVDLVLRSRYQVGAGSEPPPWTSSYPLPRATTAREEVARYEGLLRDAGRALEGAQRLAEDESRYFRLLFDHGEDGLEPIVRAALRLLGATVEDPVERGKADGRLTDPFGRRAILEVKGLTGSISRDDIRQLQDWWNEAVTNESFDGKGILIANTYRTVPPPERGRAFPEDCVGAAKRFHQSLVSTTQLFRALADLQAGRFDQKLFWDAVMQADGPATLPEA
jgi:hypothetical protein